MSVQFLSQGTLDQLRKRLPDNQDLYIAGDASAALTSVTPQTLNSRIQADEPPQLDLPTSNDLKDGENARRIYRWLSRMTPVQAADPRLWAYMTHVVYAKYTARRWPISKDSEVLTRIRERYFVEGRGLASLVRNAIARLWWFGYLSYDDTRADHFELTDVLVSLQDIQVAFLERAIGRSRMLLRGVLQAWSSRMQQGNEIKNKGKAVQTWARLIRLHGAVALLDSLPKQQVDNLVRAKLSAALNESWTAAAEAEQSEPEAGE